MYYVNTLESISQTIKPTSEEDQVGVTEPEPVFKYSLMIYL